MIVPEFTTFDEAFAFSMSEMARSFEALADGDIDLARALNASASEANKLAGSLIHKDPS